jgi:hypothetical protein
MMISHEIRVIRRLAEVIEPGFGLDGVDAEPENIEDMMHSLQT